MFKMGCSMARRILGPGSAGGHQDQGPNCFATSSGQDGSKKSASRSAGNKGAALAATNASGENNATKASQPSSELNDFSKLEQDPRLPLNVRQIFKITKSWKAIARTMSKTGTAMFLNLFEQNENLFHLFDRFQHLKGKQLHESMELREHAATVMATLDTSINSLSDYDNFVSYLHSIGQLHRKVPGFKREYFWEIEQPFMKAVKQTLDERCNETIEEIYKIAIKLIIETIADGYGQDNGDNVQGADSSRSTKDGDNDDNSAGGVSKKRDDQVGDKGQGSGQGSSSNDNNIKRSGDKNNNDAKSDGRGRQAGALCSSGGVQASLQQNQQTSERSSSGVTNGRSCNKPNVVSVSEKTRAQPNCSMTIAKRAMARLVAWARVGFARAKMKPKMSAMVSSGDDNHPHQQQQQQAANKTETELAARKPASESEYTDELIRATRELMSATESLIASCRQSCGRNHESGNEEEEEEEEEEEADQRTENRVARKLTNWKGLLADLNCSLMNYTNGGQKHSTTSRTRQFGRRIFASRPGRCNAKGQQQSTAARATATISSLLGPNKETVVSSADNFTLDSQGTSTKTANCKVNHDAMDKIAAPVLCPMRRNDTKDLEQGSVVLAAAKPNATAGTNLCMAPPPTSTTRTSHEAKGSARGSEASGHDASPASGDVAGVALDGGLLARRTLVKKSRYSTSSGKIDATNDDDDDDETPNRAALAAGNAAANGSQDHPYRTTENKRPTRAIDSSRPVGPQATNPTTRKQSGLPKTKTSYHSNGPPDDRSWSLNNAAQLVPARRCPVTRSGLGLGELSLLRQDNETALAAAAPISRDVSGPDRGRGLNELNQLCPSSLGVILAGPRACLATDGKGQMHKRQLASAVAGVDGAQALNLISTTKTHSDDDDDDYGDGKQVPKVVSSEMVANSDKLHCPSVGPTRCDCRPEQPNSNTKPIVESNCKQVTTSSSQTETLLLNGENRLKKLLHDIEHRAPHLDGCAEDKQGELVEFRTVIILIDKLILAMVASSIKEMSTTISGCSSSNNNNHNEYKPTKLGVFCRPTTQVN